MLVKKLAIRSGKLINSLGIEIKQVLSKGEIVRKILREVANMKYECKKNTN